MIKKMIALNRQCSKYLLRRFPNFFGSPSYIDELKKRIDCSITILHPERIIEVGGIDRPILSRGSSYSYIGVDIEVRDRCYEIYDRFFVQSIESPLEISGNMVISTTLLEHVPDNQAAIRNIVRALEPDGVTHHYIPSKWHPYSIALRIVGPVIQKKLIPLLRPGAEHVSGYPAYFDHCTARAMRKLFLKSGLVNVESKAFYDANDYFAFFLPAYVAVSVFEALCRKLNLELLASGFVISGVKPSSQTEMISR
jgi:hypothetical protein